MFVSCDIPALNDTSFTAKCEAYAIADVGTSRPVLSLCMNDGTVYVLQGEYEHTIGSHIIVDTSSMPGKGVGIAHKKLVLRLASSVPMLERGNPRVCRLIGGTSQSTLVGAKRTQTKKDRD